MALMRRTFRSLRPGSWVLVLVGCGLVVAGIAAVSLPAAAVLAGLLLVAAGIEVADR